MLIRRAKVEDIEKIREIYNEAVRNTTVTFDIEEKTYEDRLDWFKKYNNRYTLLVCEENNVILGWGSFSKYSDKLAYEGTCELSIYIDKNHRNKGIGKKILEELLIKGKENGIRVILSRVTKDNKISKKIHDKYGFELVGTMKEVGYKFGRYLDVCIYQKLI